MMSLNIVLQMIASAKEEQKKAELQEGEVVNMVS